MLDGFFSKLNVHNFADQYRNLIMVLLLNVPVIFLLLISNIKHPDFSLFQFFYLFCVIIGYYVLVIFLLTSIPFFIFYPVKPIRIFSIIAIISIYIYYLLVDHFVYLISKLHIDLFWLEVIINDHDGFGLPASTFRNVFLVFLAVIALEIGILKISHKIKKVKYLVVTFLIIVISAFAISQVIHIVAYEKNDIRITGITPHLPLYIPIISRRDARKYGDLLPLSDEPIEQDIAEKNSSLNYPRRDLEFRQSTEYDNPNILVIFLESWRFDAMTEEITPNIYELGQKSSVFNNHFSSGNSTVSGIFGFFYAIHPTYWTSVKANSSMIDNPVFIDMLEENDYSFGVYAKSNFNRHKIKDTIFRGIEVDESFAGKSIVEQDEDLTRKTIEFIHEQAETQSPYMAFAFYKSDHFPYDYPEDDSIFLPAANINFILTDDDTDPEPYMNDYKNATHYVDALIGKILQEVCSLGGMENTIIIISTDHSDELNDNRANYWGHGSNFTKYQVMVPLVVYIPGKEPQVINYPTTHIDIIPTIMRDIYGCTNDMKDYSNGRYLFEKQLKERPIVSRNYINHAFIFGDNVYEIYPMYVKKYKLYDVNIKAPAPSPHMLKTVIDEISCFYQENKTASTE